MSTTVTVQPADLPLACLYRWEKERPDAIYLSQPMRGGTMLDITWAQAASQVRCMASWLKGQGWPAGSRVAIIGKNSAHWILADLAIAMAGYVSVPVYPTFNGEALSYILLHSECRALFIGKMDGTRNLDTGIPPGLPLIALPLAPGMHAHQWLELVHANDPLTVNTQPDGEQTSTIIYTSGTTGKPKGVVHTFNSMAWGVSSATQRVPMHSEDRFISYLPLAHVAERMLLEQASLRCGGRVFFQSHRTLSYKTCFGRDLRFFSRCRACGPSSNRVSTPKSMSASCACCCAFRWSALRSAGKFCKVWGWTNAVSLRVAQRPCRQTCCSGTATSAWI